ncbi:MAG: response regulator [Myxococcota bacterium]
MTKILLAESQAIVREGLRFILSQNPDWEVVGEAVDGPSVLKMVPRLKPDLVVTETFLPRLSGLEVTAEIVRSEPSVKVLIVASQRRGNLIQAALEAGARGYVTKASSPKELLKAVEIVLQGGNYLSPDIVSHLVDTVTGRGGTMERGLGCLTHREREVLQLIAEGLSSKEIAASAGVSPRTVESYRATLMQKLDIHKASGLVRFAIREGLVEA